MKNAPAVTGESELHEHHPQQKSDGNGGGGHQQYFCGKSFAGKIIGKSIDDSHSHDGFKGNFYQIRNLHGNSCMIVRKR